MVHVQIIQVLFRNNHYWFCQTVSHSDKNEPTASEESLIDHQTFIPVPIKSLGHVLNQCAGEGTEKKPSTLSVSGVPPHYGNGTCCAKSKLTV